MDAQTTGAKIAQLRKRKGLTQKDVAERLHVSTAAVSKWERGLNYPDLSLLEPLAQALDTTAADLLGLTDSPAEQVIRGVTEVSEQTQAAAVKERLRTAGLLAAGTVMLVLFTVLAVFIVGEDALLHRVYARGGLNVLALALGFASWGTAAAGCFARRRQPVFMAVSLALCALALYIPTLITDLVMRFEHYGTVEDTIAGYNFGSLVLLCGTAIFHAVGWIARRKG